MARLRRPVTLVLCALAIFVLAACGAGTVSQPDAPRVVTYRRDQATTLLWDGRVLVTGGRDRDGAPLASAEVYDPADGTWSATGALGSPRYGHTASVLVDGRVLVTGGSGCRRNCTEADASATAEIYDPQSETWSQTTNMQASRQGHAAAVLSDGRVLVAGGRGIDGGSAEPPARFPPSLRSSELYDPRTGRWSAIPPMHRGRAGQHSVALWDGRVVMAGGYEGTVVQYDDELTEGGRAQYGLTPETIEVFDPVTGAWALSPRATITTIEWVGARSDGTLLIAGGLYQDRVQLYDPDGQRWSTPSDRDPTAPDRSTLVLLDDAHLLATGGLSGADNEHVAAVGTTALLQTDTNAWKTVGEMTTPRVRHTAVRLPNGSVLVFGGYQIRAGRLRHGQSPVLTSEVYDPATDRWSAHGSPADTSADRGR